MKILSTYLVLLFCFIVLAHSFDTDSDNILNFYQQSNSTGTQTPQQQLSCGIGASSSKTSRIVGGRNAKPGEFPYIVYLNVISGLIFKTKSTCGGAIIDDRHILTAAHCVKFCGLSLGGVKSIKAYLGEHSISERDEGNAFEISDIFVHKDYNCWGQVIKRTPRNDIALLRTRERMKFGLKQGGRGSINSVCLPDGSSTYDQKGGEKVLIAGWGLMRTLPMKLADVLQATELKVLDHISCETLWKTLGSGKIEKLSHVCLMNPPNKRHSSACMGDSGGPAVGVVDGKHYLVGVTSFGDSDCDSPAPNVYTRINSFVKWIEDAKRYLAAKGSM